MLKQEVIFQKKRKKIKKEKCRNRRTLTSGSSLEISFSTTASLSILISEPLFHLFTSSSPLFFFPFTMGTTCTINFITIIQPNFLGSALNFFLNTHLKISTKTETNFFSKSKQLKKEGNAHRSVAEAAGGGLLGGGERGPAAEEERRRLVPLSALAGGGGGRAADPLLLPPPHPAAENRRRGAGGVARRRSALPPFHFRRRRRYDEECYVVADGERKLQRLSLSS